MKISRRAKEGITGYLFILPNLIGFFVFTGIALGFSFVISFTDWDALSDLSEISFVGITNYVNVFKDRWFIDSILNNFWFLAIIPIQMMLSLILAIVLNGDIVGKTFLRAMFYVPYITSIVAIALIWSMLLHPTSGLINTVLSGLGVLNPPKWLGSSAWVKPSIALMLIWQTLGYNMILFLAGLQGIPKQLYEASDMDGATIIKKFYYITLPMISPVSFFVVIIAVIGTFTMWTNIQILTQGGPGTASTVIGFYIYRNAFTYSKMGYASAIAWVLFLIIFIVTIIQWRAQKKWVTSYV